MPARHVASNIPRSRRRRPTQGPGTTATPAATPAAGPAGAGAGPGT